MSNNNFLEILKRIWGYWIGSTNIKLKYKSENYNNIFTVYVHSDWGCNDDDRKNAIWYWFMLYDNWFICWNIKR